MSSVYGELSGARRFAEQRMYGLSDAPRGRGRLRTVEWWGLGWLNSWSGACRRVGHRCDLWC